MGRQTQDEMLLCSNELYVVGQCRHSNFANNRFASACDSRPSSSFHSRDDRLVEARLKIR